MAKVHNSLGLLVLDATLPTFSSFGVPISFAEYKEKTGIDLDELFAYNADDSTLYVKTVTKLLAIECAGNYGTHNVSLAYLTVDNDGDNPCMVVHSSLDNEASISSVAALLVDVINGTITLREI